MIVVRASSCAAIARIVGPIDAVGMFRTIVLGSYRSAYGGRVRLHSFGTNCPCIRSIAPRNSTMTEPVRQVRTVHVVG